MSDDGDGRIKGTFGSVLAKEAEFDAGLSWKQFRPFRETVLVRMMDRKLMTRGGIVLPDTAQEESTVGEVLAVADGETDLRVGDRVLIAKTTAMTAIRPFQAEDANIVVLNHFPGRESDILGKFVVGDL